MRSMWLASVASLLFALATGATAKGDESSIKPNVRALETRFRVVKQRYDADKRQYVLILQAKDTSDKPCNFDASFQDADDKEVKAVKLDFDDGGRQTTQGERYTAMIKYPTRKTMEKVTQIVITKSD
jgi:hypothetical protein